MKALKIFLLICMFPFGVHAQKNLHRESKTNIAFSRNLLLDCIKDSFQSFKRVYTIDSCKYTIVNDKLIVNRKQVNKTITLHIGQSIILNKGDTLQWNLNN